MVAGLSQQLFVEREHHYREVTVGLAVTETQGVLPAISLVAAEVALVVPVVTRRLLLAAAAEREFNQALQAPLPPTAVAAVVVSTQPEALPGLAEPAAVGPEMFTVQQRRKMAKPLQVVAVVAPGIRVLVPVPALVATAAQELLSCATQFQR